MKNITKQYQDLLEGKMSRDNFVRNCRQQFPQFISPITSVDDAIKILKGKRIISEGLYDRVSTNLVPSTDDMPIKDVIPTMDSDPYQQGYDDNRDGYELNQCPYKAGTEQMALWRDGWLDYESEKQMAHDEETFRRETGDAEYEEPVRESLQEAEKPEGKYQKATGKDEYGNFKDIDNVNFTTFLRAVAFEVSKRSDISDDMLPSIMEKIAKKMRKDPNAYRELVIANYADIAKQDAPLQMKEVKPGNMVDKDNGMKEIKGQEKPKATSAPKTENKKGKPKGVKEMGIKPKTATGIKQTMDLPGKEQVLESIVNSLKKSLTEDTHFKYTRGQQVNTPDGPGIITNIVGGTFTVKFDWGEGDYQVNTINHYMQKTPEPILVTPDNEPIYDPEIPGLGLTEDQTEEGFMTGVNLGGSFDKLKNTMDVEQEFRSIMQNYDWYYEMSDDPRVYDRGKAVDQKLKQIAKQIGKDKAAEIFNQYAPEDRKASNVFFTEKKDKYAKLKEFLKKAIKKEAIKYKAGGETFFKSETDAKSFEADLVKAKVPFTKSKA